MKMMEDDEVPRCVVCKTAEEDDSNYLNTKMKLLISKCGHRFCDQCIKREFQNKREISCPACSKPVKKGQLQDKTLEELEYNKEMSIRKKVVKDYNKTEENFESLDDYNNYLEMVEDLIYNLIHGDENIKAKAQKQWKEYRQENAILIATNDARKAEDERRLEQLISEQQRVADERRLHQVQEDEKHSQALKQQQQQLMEVALGERDEKDVIVVPATSTDPEHQITAEMEAAMLGFQPGVITGAQPQPIPGGKKGPKFGLRESKELRKKQQKAGGYDPQLPHLRNRVEAWRGLINLV